MEKRTLLAVALSVAILMVYQYFFVTPAAPPVDGKPAAEAPAKPGPIQAPATIPAPALPPLSTSAADRVKEQEVTIDNNFYTAVLTSRGGTIKSLLLKNYKDKEGKPIVFKADAALPPFSLGADESFQFAHVPFSVQGGNASLSPTVSTASLVFEYASGEYAVRRTYAFHYDTYGFDLKDEIKGLKSYWITLGSDFGIYEKDDSTHFGPVVLKDADRMEFTAKKLSEPKIITEGIKWMAQEDKYFFSSLVPKEKATEVKIWDSAGASHALVALKGTGSEANYFLYAGPKELDRLKNVGYGLEYIVDFGFFSIIARPLFWVLKLFYSISHNYGVAIIILTMVVRIPFIPLINKGQSSMKKMQDLQPRMAEVKEKYKNDPQKMQQELMGLYKKHKVNPMGGCLPMLLQIPVFFALYKVLLITIELRGAPFAFWIHDLSAKDPYYVLPIVMGATMVIQQKMTPSTMDPMQQKMMMFMPIVFTFMFLSFPSGLVVYWLVNNVLSIGQQFYMNRKVAKAAAA
jgi:YidC/Oxa1 family membrane protein insertase